MLCFPDATARTSASSHRHFSALQSLHSLPQLRLILTHPANPLIRLVFTGNSRCVLFFLAADSVSVEHDSSWLELHGASLSLLSVLSASPCARDTLSLVNWSFCPLQSPEHHYHRRLRRRGCYTRRLTSPLLLRSRSLLQRIRGELLILLVHLVQSLLGSCRRRSTAVPPCPPWSTLSSCLAVIAQGCAVNRCGVVWGVFWCFGRRRWSHRRRDIVGQRSRRCGQTREVRDDRWGRDVSDCVVQNEFLFFRFE